ncbi:alpha/beta hydrolase [uncultured Caulobacter sp.]|uniref:alpha/beta hydrolase n=1 Tax=uncultured Caulobacter sp. TaxID=158749 RepID=UPI00262BE8DC|nr:alpha/beta hydrolase [uncultured Caulobacter sp.]
MAERSLSRRAGLIALASTLTAACSPLSVFATLTPKDAARREGRGARYADGPRGGLDIYAPPVAKGPAPVAVFLYGGSWNSGRREDYGWAARAIAAQGFLTLAPDYRLYPEVKFPAFLDDCARAVRWAVDHAAGLGGDPRRIVLIGHSAGAYNAAMLALDPRYLRAAGVDPKVIRAFAGLSGPYDFLPLKGPVTQQTFGDAPDLAATQPVNFARADAPAAFLATGDKDTTVYPRNTRKLAAVLRDKGVTVEERHYPGLDHAGTVLALSRPFRGKSTLLADMAAFLKAQTA